MKLIVKWQKTIRGVGKMVNTNASMEEVYKAEVECLRKVIKKKDELIEFYQKQLELLSKELDK